MAIPSGSGAEVVKVSTAYVNATSAEQTIITGVANHIYTILSVIICEQGNADELIHLYIDDDGSTEIYLLLFQPLKARETFIWNDKFAISGTDCLRIASASSASYYYTCTYVDQDWT